MSNNKIIIILIILIIIFLILNNPYIQFAIKHYKYCTENTENTENIESINMLNNSSRIEGVMVISFNPILLYIYKNLYSSLKNVLIKPLKQYITFTRLKISNMDRLNCDWCSLANGLIKLLNDSVKYHLENKNYDKLEFDMTYLKLCCTYLEYAIYSRSKFISNEEIDRFIFDKFKSCPEKYFIKIKYIAKITLILDEIELRWCPFKSMQDYFRNNDKRFVPINKYTYYEAGRLLNKFNSIECINCNGILNNDMDIKYINTNIDESPINDYFNFVINS